MMMLKKIVLSILFLCECDLILAQDFSYPNLQKEGRTINDFVPNNWILIDSASGDLNNDKLKDIAFVIEHKETVRYIKNENNIVDTITTHPRILGIAVWNKISNQLKLIEQNNTFILTHDIPNMEDPFSNIKIVKQVLEINFYIFYSVGSWTTINTSYRFILKNNTFVLVNADNNTFNRSSNDYTHDSYNFITKKYCSTKGNDELDSKPEVKCTTLEIKSLKTLKTLKIPYDWELKKGKFL